jgi:hypothetical protein
LNDDDERSGCSLLQSNIPEFPEEDEENHKKILRMVGLWAKM